MRTISIAILILVLAVGDVWAAEKLGISFPEQKTFAGQPLVLNGLGLRLATVFKAKVYVAGLYVPQKSKSPDTLVDPKQPKLLDLHFVRDVGRKDITKAWSEGFEKTAGAQLGAFKPKIDALNAAMVDMKRDDTLTFAYEPNKGTSVAFNGKPLVTVEGAEFARALFLIWLGESPPNQELRDGLLGL